MESNINVKLLIYQVRDLLAIVSLVEKPSQTSCIGNQIYTSFSAFLPFTGIWYEGI
jgi:hypothetical protein